MRLMLAQTDPVHADVAANLAAVTAGRIIEHPVAQRIHEVDHPRRRRALTFENLVDRGQRHNRKENAVDSISIATVGYGDPPMG